MYIIITEIIQKLVKVHALYRKFITVTVFVEEEMCNKSSDKPVHAGSEI